MLERLILKFQEKSIHVIIDVEVVTLFLFFSIILLLMRTLHINEWVFKKFKEKGFFLIYSSHVWVAVLFFILTLFIRESTIYWKISLGIITCIVSFSLSSPLDRDSDLVADVTNLMAEIFDRKIAERFCLNSSSTNYPSGGRLPRTVLEINEDQVKVNTPWSVACIVDLWLKDCTKDHLVETVREYNQKSNIFQLINFDSEIDLIDRYSICINEKKYSDKSSIVQIGEDLRIRVGFDKNRILVPGAELCRFLNRCTLSFFLAVTVLAFFTYTIGIIFSVLMGIFIIAMYELEKSYQIFFKRIIPHKYKIKKRNGGNIKNSKNFESRSNHKNIDYLQPPEINGRGTMNIILFGFGRMGKLIFRFIFHNPKLYKLSNLIVNNRIFESSDAQRELVVHSVSDEIQGTLVKNLSRIVIQIKDFSCFKNYSNSNSSEFKQQSEKEFENFPDWNFEKNNYFFVLEEIPYQPPIIIFIWIFKNFIIKPSSEEEEKREIKFCRVKIYDVKHSKIISKFYISERTRVIEDTILYLEEEEKEKEIEEEEEEGEEEEEEDNKITKNLRILDGTGRNKDIKSGLKFQKIRYINKTLKNPKKINGGEQQRNKIPVVISRPLIDENKKYPNNYVFGTSNPNNLNQEKDYINSLILSGASCSTNVAFVVLHVLIRFLRSKLNVLDSQIIYMMIYICHSNTNSDVWLSKPGKIGTGVVTRVSPSGATALLSTLLPSLKQKINVSAYRMPHLDVMFDLIKISFKVKENQKLLKNPKKMEKQIIDFVNTFPKWLISANEQKSENYNNTFSSDRFIRGKSVSQILNVKVQRKGVNGFCLRVACAGDNEHGYVSQYMRTAYSTLKVL